MGLEQHDFIEKRAHKRVPVLHHTRAVGSEGQPLSLVIVDLSAGGLMARCDHSLTTGDRLQVHVPGIGLRSAHVCWALGGRIGCEFDMPISLEAYLAVTAK